jgi:glycosyltransferase involved in cell wall biosynthesis
LVGLKKAGIPIVVRLSDFAMVCPQEHCLRDDLPCELCVNGNLWHSIFYRCVQNSFVASTLNVLATHFHRFRHYFDLIDVFVTTNYFVYYMMLKIGFSKNRLRCIPTFTDIESFKPNISLLKKNHILYVGRLEYVKGIHVLIDALSLLYQRRPDLNIKTTLLGSGNEKYHNLLERNIKKAGIENAIQLAGEVNSSEVAELLNKSFLSVIPSLCYESLPNSILESYSCGTPVLASDIGSLRECVTHGETGYLFCPGNAENLSMWLEYCFDHPEKTNKMGQKARIVAQKKYSPEGHIVSLESLFAELIG